MGYTATDAIGKAKSYGRSKGAVSSRLLSYEEANALKAKESSNIKIKTMYRGTANTADGYLYYWLGSAFDTRNVWVVGGDGGSSWPRHLQRQHMVRGAPSYNYLKI